MVWLLIILLTPSGERIESGVELSRSICRIEKALTHAAMLTDAKDYRLVSVDCLPVVKK